MHRILAATLVLAALAACTAEPAPTASIEQPIIGGTLAPNDHAVMLLASYPPNRSVLATCTAVLIAPTVLATAAHCVDAPNHPNYLYGVFRGADAAIYPRLVDLEPHLVAVIAVHAHPDYSTSPPFRADIGVVILAAPITDVAPIRLWRTPPGALIGSPARIVGYGQAVVGTFSNTRRQATTVVAGVDSGDTVRVGDPGHVTCLGDSGGPALVDDGGGTEVLLGIDSYADNGNCDLPAHFRRADVYQGFFDGYTGDSPPVVDAGVGSPDATPPDDRDDDGGCAAAPGAGAAPITLALALLLGRRRRRRRLASW